MAKTTKKTHPADAINVADLAKATTFQATLMIGPGKFEKVTAETLAAIRAKAQEMEKATGTSRRAIIHAFVNGKAVPIPASYDGGKSIDPAALGGKPNAKAAAAKAAKPAAKPAAKAAKPAAAKKAAKPAAKKAAAAKAPRETRKGSKTEQVLAMLRKGATRAAIVEATGWSVDLKQLAARKGLKLRKDAEGVITAA